MGGAGIDEDRTYTNMLTATFYFKNIDSKHLNEYFVYFGDGTYVDFQNATKDNKEYYIVHKYIKPDTYYVVLKSDKKCMGNKCDDMYINVSNQTYNNGLVYPQQTSFKIIGIMKL